MADDLGDRMKGYEAVEDQRFDSALPIYARIDGRSFSRFTRGMDRPFDADMTQAMIETAKALVQKTHARVGYVQSDEISLVWLGAVEGAQTIFDGRKQKLCSVLAGIATAAFTAEILRSERLSRFSDRLPHFDCRVMNLPSETEAANMLLWREQDARKNAISMAARASFSAKQLHGKSGPEMLRMIEAAGVDFNEFPAAFTRGTFVRRETFERRFTAEELKKIPEPHRPEPGHLVTRSAVRTVPIPPATFQTVADLLAA